MAGWRTMPWSLNDFFSRRKPVKEGTVESLSDQALEEFFRNFQTRADSHNKREDRTDLQVTVGAIFDGHYYVDGNSTKGSCRRFFVTTPFWIFSARQVQNRIEFYLLPAIQISRLLDVETPSRLKLRVVITGESDAVNWEVDGVTVTREEIDILFSVLFNDLVKKSKIDSGLTPPLTADEYSFTGGMRELIRAKDNITRDLVFEQENIRSRIARDIHDDIISDLLYLRRSFAGDERVSDDEVVALLDDVTGRLRQVCHDLAPRELKEWGLIVALQDLLHRFSLRTQITCLFDHTSFPELPYEVELQIWRIVQELLNNIEKHAHSTHISVVVSTEDGLSRVCVRDNGIGFDPLTSGQQSNGLEGGDGQHIIHERVQLISQTHPASVSFQSLPGKGTTVILTIGEHLQEGI